jgi:hypothetical protein
LESFIQYYTRPWHGGVAQWASHPPQGMKTRVRIPPGYKVLEEVIAMLLYAIDLIYIVCVLKKRSKGMYWPQKIKYYTSCKRVVKFQQFYYSN